MLNTFVEIVAGSKARGLPITAIFILRFKLLPAKTGLGKGLPWVSTVAEKHDDSFARLSSLIQEELVPPLLQFEAVQTT